MKKILFDILIMATIVVTIVYVYRTYGEQIQTAIVGEQKPVIFIHGTPVAVTVADSDSERRQGLSGVKKLKESHGMLFIFDHEDTYGMWMKDMHIPLDLIFIDDDLQVVHIEPNVKPETYPETFSSDEPARFVLEVNAFFAQNYSIQEGDTVILPPGVIPKDLIRVLQ